jgi:hypothetical protein
MNKALVMIIAFLFSFSAFALGALDDGLTPAQRYSAGLMFSGAHDSQELLYCSPAARAANIPKAIDNEVVLHVFPNGGSIVVKDQLVQINKIINSTLSTLSSDSAVKNRSVCTGFYFEESSHVGNALSMGEGYLIFDYRLFQFLYALPDEKRSSWVYEFLVLHEFAHQLQYWNNDIEVSKTLNRLQNSRTPELAADCTAGALLRLNNLNLSPILYAVSFRGVQGAAEALGDYKKTADDHHGTPAERLAAATYGSQLIQQMRVSILMGLTQPTSSDILKSCNAYVTSH